MRSVFNLLHRWLGLTVAVFLVVAGLTGSVLAFYDELDVWTNPGLYRTQPAFAAARQLDSFELRERLLQQVPEITVNYIPLRQVPGTAALFYNDLASDGEDGDYFLDLYTGELKGSRLWGDITQGKKNLIPFIYIFHETLALGIVGEYLFGVVALLWTLDCFIGLYLTFPIRAKRKKKPWIARWKPAWLLRWSAGSYKLNFDLHRAGGLWVWAMLLVFAWSGVSFNLNDEVYSPVMKTLFEMEAETDAIPDLPESLLNPDISFRQAAAIGEALMQEQAELLGFEAGLGDSLYYDAEKGIYYYDFSSSADIHDNPSSSIAFSAIDGQYLNIFLPNREPAGIQVTDWIEGLHRARIGGIAIQIFVCVLGVVVMMLSITGIIIWWRKRKSRISKKIKNHSKELKIAIVDS